MAHTESVAPGTTITVSVPAQTKKMRLDTFLADYFTRYSRTFFQKIAKLGLILVNKTKTTKSSLIVQENDAISITFPQETKREVCPEIAQECKDISVNIIFEHPDFFIIEKPANLTVHPPDKSSRECTLVDWLICNYPAIKKVGHEDRPGIVHRLDKDTSGLMIISRNDYAHEKIAQLFKNRVITKKYYALVTGHPEKSGTIDYPIDRHPIYRTRMTHQSGGGRHALTLYKVEQYFEKDNTEYSLLDIEIKTGRTHQIRVHMAAIGHSILGDTTYGTKSKKIKRQALHAHHLSFDYDGKRYEFESPLPADMQKLIQ